MNTVNVTVKIIAQVNGISLVLLPIENEPVPLKPLCEAIGVDFEGQRQRVERDEILSSTAFMIKAVAADGKEREMFCIPFKYVFGWLFSIDTGRVNEEVRQTVIQYKIQCYDVLYDHFFKKAFRQLQAKEMEIKLLEEINELNETQKNITFELRTKKTRLDKIREERLKDDPTLF